MKIVTIYRGQLELEKFHLLSPSITIGRSPTNDVVLRAPGVDSIHFLVEWIGTGEFDPTAKNIWTISDVSKKALIGGKSSAAEGIILEGDKVEISGFRFEVRDDHLEAKPVIGGAIKGRLSKSPTLVGSSIMGEPVLEFVQIRSDSGAVEEVLHLPKMVASPARSLVSNAPDLKLEWEQNQAKLLLAGLSQVEIFNRGQKVPAGSTYKLQSNDLIQIHSQNHDFYFRFVQKINVPLVPRVFLTDPLLKKLLLAAVGLVILFLILALWPSTQVVEEVVPPRVAVIEIKTVADALPPPPPPPPPKETVEPQKVKAGIENTQPNSNPGAAAKPKFVGEKKTGVGLNNTAPPGAKNQLGILGVLKGGAKKGPGVRADMLLNQGIITDSVSAKGGDSAVVVKNPPAGVVGRGGGSDPKGSSGEELVAAQTTFGGGDEYNPSSVGPISRAGGKGSGFEAGSSLGGKGSGLGSGKSSGTSDIGSLDTNSFDVEGGLDKETVRRVIAGYRGQIRVCYDKALLMQPSLKGRVVYRWGISPQGPVTSVVVQSSSLTSKQLESCVLEVIRGMKFPTAPNGRPTTVIYPFQFQPRG